MAGGVACRRPDTAEDSGGGRRAARLRDLHRQQLLLLQQQPAQSRGLLLRSARSASPLPLHIGDDQRLGRRTGMTSNPISGRTRSAPTVRRQQQHRVQQERTAVRSGDHDGLQPVPDPSAAQDRVPRIRPQAQRHRAKARRQACVVHVMGLCRQAGDDRRNWPRPIRRPETTTTPLSSRQASPSRGR